MDNRIYVRFKGKTLGPLTAEKVQGLIARGQITRMHELSSDGLSWVPAESFGSFFARPQATTVTATPQNTATQANQVERQSTAESTPTTSVPRPGQPAEEAIQWYAHLNGVSSGPFPTSRILGLISSGQVTSSTLVWRSGFDDWKPAAESFPDNFGRTTSQGSQSPTSGPYQFTGSQGPTTYSGQMNPSDTLVAACHVASKARPWIIYLAISCFILGGLICLYSVLVMIINPGENIFGSERVGNVISGLVGLVQSAVIITGGVLLLKYAMALKNVRQGTEWALVTALQHLSRFWLYAGIVAIVVQVLTIGIAILIMVAAAAASN